jgi:endonuclease/exonuclease/phosphatase family metal-dependent hydrolase
MMQNTTKPRKKFLRLILLVLGVPAALLVLGLALFAVNGLILADGETPRVGYTSHPAEEAPSEGPRDIKVVTINIAKLFLHKKGFSFAKPEQVRDRLRRVAEAIRAQDPDIVFLSETVRQCSACPVDQVAEIANAVGMHTWVLGENYNFGLPFYRIVGGNAILSRWPLVPVKNQSLAGRKPFWVTKNNRRVLWCEMTLCGKSLLLASVHNDSFNIKNNLAQTRQILEFAGERPLLIAGDFNANPDEEPMLLLKETGRFSGEFDGPKTFPADNPRQTIDFILVPAAWELISHRVIDDTGSDHCLVCSVFRIP